MSPRNRHQMAKDSRWSLVDTAEDQQALLIAIEECTEAIRVHALNFDPLNPVANMYEIQREIKTQQALVEHLRQALKRKRDRIEQAIKGE